MPGGASMSVAEQGSVIQRWIAAWNAKDLDAAVELLAEEYVRHDANLPEVVGPHAQRDFLAGLFAWMSTSEAQAVARRETDPASAIRVLDLWGWLEGVSFDSRRVTESITSAIDSR